MLEHGGEDERQEMTIDTILQLAMTFGSGVLGVGVTFATLRAKAHRNSTDIKGVRSDVDMITGNPVGRPVFILRDECKKQVEVMTGELTALSAKIDGFQRYARYQLSKDGMSLTEVNELLGEH